MLRTPGPEEPQFYLHSLPTLPTPDQLLVWLEQGNTVLGLARGGTTGLRHIGKISQPIKKDH